MNRELKFRAWIPLFEEMIVLENTGLQKYDCENGYSVGFTADGYSKIWAHENYGKVDDAILMQYTGLKDKNGKEIYEGDIVINIDQDKRKVAYIQNSFEMILLNGKRPANNVIWHFQAEVIGNIYENPELLTPA